MKHSLQWDIFCKVIDNFGDIGVCWRLSADLARRGHSVRLWVDDASALAWMAPGGCAGVRVLPWCEPPELPAAGLDLRATGLDLPATSLDLSAAGLEQQPPDVLIEAFGCDIPFQFLAACADQSRASGIKPVWLNLEYLSAEPYVERCHALPSLVQRGPAAGCTKWFFYPGFTEATGGLLREPDLAERQARFDRGAWLAAQGIAWQGNSRKPSSDDSSGEKLISLFCYEPSALGALLAQLAEQGLAGAPVRVLVAAGRAEQAVKAALKAQINPRPSGDTLVSHQPQGIGRPASEDKWLCTNDTARGRLSISYLPLLTQADFDHLLWACDLNFVRGEDSVIRALWAGKPFIWQIYPQDDDAHLAKLQAFLDMLEAPPSLRAFHAAWSQGGADPQAIGAALAELPAWQACALAARARLMAQQDLTSRLLGFVAKNR
jgi:uncharacterized repeat protein (TIGR03837 family)